MFGTLESLTLRHYAGTVFDGFFSQSSHCLRHISLREPTADGAIIAQAIQAMSGSLRSLEISHWYGQPGTPVDQTLAAIATVRSLHSLKLEFCAGVSVALLEPLVVGVVGQAPLCPNIRNACFRSLKGEDAKEFFQRLRESIKQRFLYDGMVNDRSVCPLWIDED
jgi:hypothetical protein